MYSVNVYIGASAPPIVHLQKSKSMQNFKSTTKSRCDTAYEHQLFKKRHYP